MRDGPDRSALAILVLGLAGIAVAAYLTIAHYGVTSLACTVSSVIDCEAVTTSSYSIVPGTTLPVSVPGLLWAVVVAATGAVLLVRGPIRGLEVGLALWSGLALLGVLYFVRAEIVVIGRICMWCTAFHLIVLVTLLLAIVRLQGSEAAEDGTEDTAAQ